jgi:hypothetical protein
MKFTDAMLRRFWSKVDKRSPTECWPWLGCRCSKGYGRLGIRGLNLRAPRVAWMIAFDRNIPEGLIVLHRCDTPACVNPSHLAIGTIRDNALDAKLRGRLRSKGTRGEQHGRTKLTDDIIRSIRSSGERHSVIASRYGLNRSTVSKIKRGERWQHVA